MKVDIIHKHVSKKLASLYLFKIWNKIIYKEIGKIEFKYTQTGCNCV